MGRSQVGVFCSSPWVSMFMLSILVLIVLPGAGVDGSSLVITMGLVIGASGSSLKQKWINIRSNRVIQDLSSRMVI